MRGFGDSIPAFMLLRRRDEARPMGDDEPDGPEDNGSDLAA
ncbi:hypothetical protein GT370_06945 [Acidocella sp. MX-AZ03]|nr:hypothetical protein [Acidocella sp. MX-AZ03]WBO60505.1 hypothetical protein GT370_06945 [Acidocella sp. MX-AZ03]